MSEKVLKITHKSYQSLKKLSDKFLMPMKQIVEIMTNYFYENQNFLNIEQV